MKTILKICCIFLIQLSFSQQGSLDTSFDLDGKKYFGFGSSNDYGEFIIIQPDNKIIVGGRSSLSGGNLSFALARLNANGNFDSTFGVGGKVTTTFGTDGFEAVDGALQTDGKIVVIGNQFTNSSLGYSQIAIVRYNSNGSLDTSFDSDGMAFTQIQNSNEDFAKSIKIQSDGKIIVGIQSKINSNNDFVILRYNSNGSLDSSFGIGGIARTVLNTTNENIYDIDIQMDGKILAAGYISGSSNNDLAVFRYNSDGTLDLSFATNGQFIYDFASNHNYVYGISVTSDNKIVLVGGYQNGSITSPYVARLDNNGVLDFSFDSDGILVQTTDEMLNDVFVQSDNKIIGIGTSNLKFGVWKLNENGSFDTTFGTNGKVETLVTIVYSMANKGKLQSDGKILVVGSIYNNPFMDFGIVRYHNDVSLVSEDFNSNDSFVKLYPNPSVGEFSINISEDLIGSKVTISNFLGQKIKSFIVDNEINIENLVSGVYSITVENESKFYSKKIIIK